MILLVNGKDYLRKKYENLKRKQVLSKKWRLPLKPSITIKSMSRLNKKVME